MAEATVPTMFDGFPREALTFLAELGEHNEREWFEAHRSTYEEALLEPARDLVVAIGEELHRAGIDVSADPRVNGSIFRINRDTRFSRDKRPYKDHLDLWLWQGDGPSRLCPGFWFRLTATHLLLGAGLYHFQDDVLAHYRAAVTDDKRGAQLVRVLDDLTTLGYDLGGVGYKRQPAGYATDDPRRAALLLHKGLYAGVQLPVPPEAHDGRFPTFCALRYRELVPLVDWLLALTQT
jgi:uncharacterized protein (TIGR02453 family)